MGTIPNSLPLSDIIPVSVVVAPQASPGLTFSQGLIVGSSSVIPTTGSGTLRLRVYNSVTAMIADGFAPTSPEVLAADLYFGQSPAPTTLWVGRQNLTALGTVTVGSSGGTGYVVGDVLTVVQGGGSAGLVQVTTIGGSGAVTGVAIVTGNQGNGYAVANNLATAGGSGTGAMIDVTAIGETALQAVTYCRLLQPAWYACAFVATASDADYEAIAGFIEAATPPSTFFVTSGEVAILNNTTGNLFATLKSASYRRTFMMYSTTQGGEFPNNIYAAVAMMGLAMGLNTGAVNSFFDLMFKAVAGVGSEPATPTQVLTVCGSVDRSEVGLNGNMYLDYANGAYQWTQNATMASGVFFDEVLNLDMLQNAIQVAGVNLLTSIPALPITDNGVTLMKNAFTTALNQAQQRGFIAPTGTWEGLPIGIGPGAIATGQAFPAGYMIYAPPVNTLTQGQIAARQMPPFTIALIEAGSAHSLVVSINVQR